MLNYLQFTGTEMPCADRSPSPTIPTSGEKKLSLARAPTLGRKPTKTITAVTSCSARTQTRGHHGGGGARRLNHRKS